MKKETLKYKLTTWLMTLGLASIFGVVAIVNNNNYQKTNAYNVMPEQNSVYFSTEELNNCSYTYLTYTLSQEYTFTNTYILHDNTRYNFVSIDSNKILYKEIVDDYAVQFSYTDNVWLEDGEQGAFINGLTIYSSYFAENMAKSTTISAQNLNNNTYEYLANTLNENTPTSYLQDSYIIYQNSVYLYSDFVGNDVLQYSNVDNPDYLILFHLDTNNYVWTFYNGDEDINFTDSITIFSNYIADNLYAPFTDGEDNIIDAVKSGLGLITNLATEFLIGFTTLFWNETLQELTTLGLFACVMLGIAITMAVIKLSMNVIRSNAGA